jgi:hypothetical protein
MASKGRFDNVDVPFDGAATMPSEPPPTIPMEMPTPPVTVSTLPLTMPVQSLGDLYRMTVDEYERLADADVLKNRRVELIGGYLVRKMTTKPPRL